jgi:hypothetical protein
MFPKLPHSLLRHLASHFSSHIFHPSLNQHIYTYIDCKWCFYFEEESMGWERDMRCVIASCRGRSCWTAHIVNLLLYETLIAKLLKLISY